jgi:hypothetical protein
MAKQMVGSLQNRLMEMGTRGQPVPVVGMGVTEIMYSDRYPYEITRIDLGQHVFMKPCSYQFTGGNGYGITGAVIEGAPEVEIRQNKRGQWVRVGLIYREKSGKMTPGITGRIVRLEATGKGQFYQDPGF